MRIVLLEVGCPRPSPSWTAYFDSAGRFAMPSVGLLSLAALSRPGDEVRIIDEKVSGEPESMDADLVGMSFKSMYAKRAYALADRLRAQGLKVVLGGVHASLQPEEAARHADAVVVGEGEAVWKTVVGDVEANRSRSIYRAPVEMLRLDTLPPLPVGLIDHEHYMCYSLQSARGCSFTCEFCPTRTMFGDGYRLRNVDTVMGEVHDLMDMAPKPVLFTENVFGAGDAHYVDALTRRLSDAGVPYGVLCDWMSVKPEMSVLLAKRGCRLVGINMTGREEPAEEAALRAMHEAGIALWGYMMFGFEEDTPDVFQGAVDKVRRYGVVSVAMTVLAPYPGTPMANRIERDGRIFGRDTDLFDQSHVLFQPRHMTSTELQQGFDYACNELSDLLGFDKAVAAMDGTRRGAGGTR